MSCQSHSSRFVHPNDIWWRVQRTFLCSFLHSPVTSSLLGQTFSAPYSQTPSAHVPPSMWMKKFHTHVKQQKKLLFCTSSYFWTSNCKTKFSTPPQQPATPSPLQHREPPHHYASDETYTCCCLIPAPPLFSHPHRPPRVHTYAPPLPLFLCYCIFVFYFT